MKHKHAENMMLYAQDAMETDRPWERWQFRFEEDDDWEDHKGSPIWGTDFEYRRKPRTININGHEVPEPVRSPLEIEIGTIYYIPHIYYSDMYNSYEWRGDLTDFNHLKKGIVHLSKEAAIKHTEALLSFTCEGH